jgi:hypothetical protein
MDGHEPHPHAYVILEKDQKSQQDRSNKQVQTLPEVIDFSIVHDAHPSSTRWL